MGSIPVLCTNNKEEGDYLALELAKKGQVLDLTKNNTGLQHLTIGLSWGAVQEKKRKGIIGALLGGSSSSSSNMDIDSSVVMIDNRGQIVDTVYYGSLKSSCRSIVHAGDDLTGNDRKGDKDNEEISISLSSLPSTIERLVFVANVYQGKARGQHFGQVPNSYIRVLNRDNAEELIRYNLADDYNEKRGLVVAEIYRRNSEWKFRAIGNATESDNLSTLITLAK
jgi:tellurium resistance protein TerD